MGFLRRLKFWSTQNMEGCKSKILEAWERGLENCRCYEARPFVSFRRMLGSGALEAWEAASLEFTKSGCCREDARGVMRPGVDSLRGQESWSLRFLGGCILRSKSRILEGGRMSGV